MIKFQGSLVPGNNNVKDIPVDNNVSLYPV